MQLDHVNIHVYDLAAARDFLVRLLGVEVGWRPSFEVPGDWLYLDGRPVIHTWLKTRERGLGWVDHIAFGPCGDPEAKRAELQRLGFDFNEAGLIDTDITQYFVNGPEGMKIELQCRRTPESFAVTGALTDCEAQVPQTKKTGFSAGLDREYDPQPNSLARQYMARRSGYCTRPTLMARAR